MTAAGKQTESQTCKPGFSRSAWFMESSVFPVDLSLFVWRSQIHAGKQAVMRGQKQLLSFFLLRLSLSLSGKSELNFIKKTQSDSMRAELRSPSLAPSVCCCHCRTFPVVWTDNQPICLFTQTQWPFTNGYEDIIVLFIWEYHIYPGAIWLLLSLCVDLYSMWRWH